MNQPVIAECYLVFRQRGHVPGLSPLANTQRFGARQVGYPALAAGYQMLNGSKSALLVFHDHLGYDHLIAYPVKKNNRNTLR
jgi:hypothetical protein